MSDFNSTVFQRRMQALNAARQRAQTEYSEAAALGDTDSAGDAAQTIANIDDQVESITRLAQREQARTTPREPLSEGTFMGMTPEEMARCPEAVDRIFSKSKYYDKNQWSDPEVQRRIQAGYREIEKRKGVERNG